METLAKPTQYRVIPKPDVITAFQLVRLTEDLTLSNNPDVIYAQKGAVGVISQRYFNGVYAVDFDTEYNHVNEINVAYVPSGNISTAVWAVRLDQLEFLEEVPETNE